jgi:hypothetical protein
MPSAPSKRHLNSSIDCFENCQQMKVEAGNKRKINKNRNRGLACDFCDTKFEYSWLPGAATIENRKSRRPDPDLVSHLFVFFSAI